MRAIGRAAPGLARVPYMEPGHGQGPGCPGPEGQTRAGPCQPAIYKKNLKNLKNFKKNFKKNLKKNLKNPKNL